MLKKITNILSVEDNSLRRSMILSMFCKPIGMFISIVYTPLLLSYLGEEKYGVWSTVLSVINWINYFDVGIGQGLRNTLAKYITNGDEKKSQRAVSTSYLMLSLISGSVLLVGWILIMVFDMQSVFNTKVNIRPALLVSFSSVCINFVLGLSKSLLFATQQAEKVGFITIEIQLFNLIGIFVLSRIGSGNLFLVSIVIGLSGIVVNMFHTKKVWKVFSYLRPMLSEFDKTEIKVICDVGIKFFLIQIAALILYSTDNMIITQLFGPTKVTPYGTSYTAIGTINGIFAAMIAPIWSRITVAVEQQDYNWVRNTIIRLDKLLPIMALILLVFCVAFKPISNIWLRRELEFDEGLIACMSIYFFLQIWGSIYATAMNGMSRVNLQLVLAILMAIINIPLSIFLGRDCGLLTTGVCLATDICMLISNVIQMYYVHRVLLK